MTMKSIESIKQSRGAVAPLVAIMLILIVVCVALVVDLGHIHNVKVELQRAADAAALAGAQQLTGGSGAATNARNVAVATALANTVDQDQVVIDPDFVVNPSFKEQPIVAVQPIRWDPNIVDEDGNTQTTNERITPLNMASYDTANGLWVTAQRDVDHVFFFFTGSTQVTADAIAVSSPAVPVLPLALISCVPTDKSAQNAGTLPGITICDIRSYNFKTDQDDTAAWTSLTFKPASATNINKFLQPGSGREEFNRVIFGRGVVPLTKGLENEIVDPNRPTTFNKDYEGCENIGTAINCGLGQIDPDKEIAFPEDFDPLPPPPPLVFNDSVAMDYYTGTLAFDPLSGFNPLPRWFNIYSTDTSFDAQDYFSRVWSQDGILLQGPNETDAQYATRLQYLKDGEDGDGNPFKPYNDDRFMESGGELVHKFKGNWVPNFSKAVQYAGYPKVFVNNGVEPPLLAEFLKSITDGPNNLSCNENKPLDPGHTVRTNVPIIFAGSCDEWKALSNSDEHTLSYVGLAKFLITRVWHTNSPYDCGENFVDSSGEGCSPFTPPVAADGTFSAVNFNTPAALEGLNMVPILEDEEEDASILKVYLVE